MSKKKLNTMEKAIEELDIEDSTTFKKCGCDYDDLNFCWCQFKDAFRAGVKWEKKRARKVKKKR